MSQMITSDSMSSNNNSHEHLLENHRALQQSYSDFAHDRTDLLLPIDK